jgi:uncharacterized membrane protein
LGHCAQLWVARAWARLLTSQRGQTATEFVGMLFVVAVIIAALARSDIGSSIAGGIKDLIDAVAGGGKAPPSDG